nr:peptidoglycan-binding protein [Lentibacter algarum]
MVVISLGLVGVLAACTEQNASNVASTGPIRSYEAPLKGSDPNACWGKDISPAVIETVTERVLITPEVLSEDGTVLSEAEYKDKAQRRIVKERREVWFETPCQDTLTPDIIATLQRALKARGLYSGALSGVLDARTRHAIRSFQAPQGLDSSILSLWAARKLGLVAIDLPS